MLSNRLRPRAQIGSAPCSDRQGATAVEFAITFPIVLTVFFGMLVITQAFTLRDSVEYAAYEGARRGLLLNATADDCKQAVDEFTKAMRIKGARTTVTPSNLSNSTQEITVKVEVPLNKNAWAVASFLPRNWMLSSEIKLTRGTTD